MSEAANAEDGDPFSANNRRGPESQIRTPDADRNDMPQERRSESALPTIIGNLDGTLIGADFRSQNSVRQSVRQSGCSGGTSRIFFGI
jgi:hypothetical protein